MAVADPVLRFPLLAVPPAAVAIVLLALLAVIIVVRPRRVMAPMIALTAAGAAWQAAAACLLFAVNERFALACARLGLAAASLIAPAAYHLAASNLRGFAHRRATTGAAWAIGVYSAALAIATSAMVPTVRHFSWGAFPRLDPVATIPAAVAFAAMLGASVVILLRVQRAASPGERDRLRLFSIALAVGSIALFDFLPAYGVAIYPFGWLAVLAAAAIAAYAIRKHGFTSSAPSLDPKEIISTMRDLLIVVDRSGRIRFANEAAYRFLGSAPDEMVGRQLEELMSPATEDDGTLRSRGAGDREYVFRTRSGQPIELTLSRSPILYDGETAGAVLIGRDLRERKRYEWEARRAVTLLQSTLDSTTDGILVVGHDGRVLTWNQRFTDMWGIPPELLEHEDDHDLIGHITEHLSDPAEFLRSVASLHAHPEAQSFHLLELKDGRRFEQTTIGRYLGDAPLRVWSFHDVTARVVAEEALRRAAAQIEFHAYHDALTQLPNRRLFVDRLELSLLSAKRARKNVAVLFLDLDRFKSVNDTYGHGTADELLVEIARRLRNCVRQTDTVARLGGDEFTIILPDLHDAEDAARVAEKILESVAQPAAIGETAIEVSVSVGVAIFPHDGADSETLLRNADNAMYRAKEAGRNTYQLATSQMNTRAMKRLSAHSRLRKAMADDQLTLVYQPQISIATGMTCGAEALLRWNDPDRGVVEPAEFIPTAEDSGLILPLGEWVLFTACRQLRAWSDSGGPPMRIAVNLSARQFEERELPALVRRAIDDAGIDPSRLELEIAEATALRHLEGTVEMLELLRQTGVTLAIDDFGRDYSSLRHLEALPVDAVKIDRVCVAGVAVSTTAAAIARAVIDVSTTLDLRVVAEGVESVEQLDFLRLRGCHEAQGFYFSPAVAPDAFLSFNARAERLPYVSRPA